MHQIPLIIPITRWYTPSNKIYIMAKVFFHLLVFMIFLIIINGVMFGSIPRAEAIRHRQGSAKTIQGEQKIDCSCDKFCDPFAPRIDLRCKSSGKCQEKCNQFGGVFLCSVEQGYCKCAMET